VVGHVEWVQFARVERLPERGAIVHAAETWEEPAGAGGVAAVRLARLSGDATLYTALGDDELGRRSKQELERLGVRVEAVFRDAPQRRAFTFVDSKGERTITVMGERMGPLGEDPLPWDRLAGTDAVYFTAGDQGALRAARAARVLVGTSRVFDDLLRFGVELDAVVGSSTDPSERYVRGKIHPEPHLVVLTSAGDGGKYWTADGFEGTYQAAPLPGPVADAYGGGDSFAAGLTYALGAGMVLESALGFAAREGAEAITRKGAHGG
jgi:ribokinase